MIPESGDARLMSRSVVQSCVTTQAQKKAIDEVGGVVTSNADLLDMTFLLTSKLLEYRMSAGMTLCCNSLPGLNE